ncbi:MAG: SDR family NAD(P)-dependent oxidoreductase [Candidatus Dormibacteria bacterium]|jgi:NAD(P)-dependent dehydrogenase (short-subunit alcohol dehydrogenase family)
MEATARDYAQLFRLDGRSALVVGAGSGIGREAALALAAQGASVTCSDLDQGGAEQTASLAGEPARWRVVDVLDRESVFSLAKEHHNLDVLVFTAGVNVRKRLLDYADSEFDRVVNLNLRASFHLIQAFGAVMAARGRGSIIGISSIRAVTVEPGQGVYAATKAGLEQLLRTAAAELGPSGVRANAIAPGVVETPLTTQIRAVPEWYRAYSEKTALRRWASAWEMAGAVVYLAGDAASYVTGSVLTVDGGWTAIDGRYEPPQGRR